MPGTCLCLSEAFGLKPERSVANPVKAMKELVVAGFRPRPRPELCVLRRDQELRISEGRQGCNRMVFSQYCSVKEWQDGYWLAAGSTLFRSGHVRVKLRWQDRRARMQLAQFESRDIRGV